MKKTLVTVAVLTAAGIGASTFLVPGAAEMGLLFFKDKRFDEARESYERQVADGTASPDTINTLVDLYLQNNDLESAINLMERYIDEHPDDITARRKLGQLYQYAQRPDDYLRNLEEINRLNPSAETLAQLSQIYNYRGDYDSQTEALRQLIGMEKESNPQHFVDLANILAARQSRPEAIDALKGLQERHAAAFTFAEEELLVSLLLDEKRTDEAYAQALAWRNKMPTPPAHETARLINLLHYKGAPAMAAQLMASFDEETIAGNPALLEEHILLQLDAGQEEEAYAQLKKLNDEDRLSPELKNRLLFMAFTRGDEKTASPLIANLDISTLNESQALSLLELSLARGDKTLQTKLAKAFESEEAKTQYPMLAAMLAVTRKQKDADAQLTALAERELSAGQNLQIARICQRARNNACTTRFMNRLPVARELSDADLASAASIYLDMKAYDKGYALLSNAGERPDSPALSDIRIKFAALRGDEKAVNAWLVSRGEHASERTLKDLYFAARDTRHHSLATRIGETLFARYPNTETRSLLASSYAGSGQYAKAVTLLRGSRDMSSADEANYLMALTKLARSNPQYREELGQFAKTRLNGSLPEQRKLALIYALIEARQLDPAMPYIRDYALKRGGNWAYLYASELTKRGQHEEARSFWLQLANARTTSPEQKRQIAYNLLAGGDVASAESIFRGLAYNAPAGSDDVRALTYLWGPRLNAEQLDWLASRLNDAPPSEQAYWADLIANHSSEDELMALAESRHPETLGQPAIFERYVRTLARRGELREAHGPLFAGVQEYNDPALMWVYAKTARETGNMQAAREAYEALLARDPANNDVIRELATLSYAQADYRASDMFLREYLNTGAQTDSPEKTYPLYYTYAELLRRSRQHDAAVPYYQHTIELIDYAGLQTPEAQSHKAQSMIMSGREAEGLDLFRQTTEAYPQDDNLKADYIAALVGLKRYEEARALLADPMMRLAQPAEAPQSLPLPQGLIASQTYYAGNSEVVLELTSAGDDARQLATNAADLPWVNYASEGYGKVLISARPGYVLTTQNDASGNPALVPMPMSDDESRRQLRLRYEMLAARTDLEDGKVHAATTRLNSLLAQYPGDAQLMGFTANAEYYGGNWARAQALLNAAGRISPENEDIALLERNVRRNHAPNVKLDHEWVNRKRSDENITTLSAHTIATENLVVGMNVKNNHVSAKNTRRDDGRVGKFSANRQQMEFYGIYHWENGQRIRAALFANNDTPGAALAYEFLNPLGESGVGIEYHKPYWEYVEGVLDNATRDRLSVWHTVKPTTRLSFRLEPGLNRYHTDDDSNLATTWSLDGRVSWQLIESLPYLSLNYGLSAEYMIDKNNNRVDALGDGYKTLPVVSREIHFLALAANYDFDERTYGDGLIGYGVDRLGGHGPMVEGRLTHEFTEAIDAQLRASYGLDTKESDNNITRVGGYLRYRF